MDDGGGPYRRLVIRNATIIDGTGARFVEEGGRVTRIYIGDGFFDRVDAPTPRD